MTTTQPLNTYDPPVNLPALSAVPDAVAAPWANYARLVALRSQAQSGRDAAEAAVRDGVQADEMALAEHMVSGQGTEPAPVAGSREDDLKVATARVVAAATAVQMGYRELSAAVAEAAPEWSPQVAQEHLDAVVRFEAAAADLRAAGEALMSTGGLMAMLSEPGRLTVGSYRTGAWVGEATAAVGHALVQVRQSAPVFV